MTELSTLWLPILVSSVVVFIASSIIHMAPLWHKSDYPKVPNEDAVMDALRPLAIPPGDYMVPRAQGMAEMGSPEFAEKIKRGPNVILTVLPDRPFSMGRNLSLWFAYVLVVSFLAAYVAGRALVPGAEYLSVFRFAGVAAFLSYTVALWHVTIWYGRGLDLTLKSTFDGLIYAVLTAGVFGALWP